MEKRKAYSAKILFLTALMSVSSCGIYKSQFDCLPGKGVGCESVSKVNDLINDEALDAFVEAKEETRSQKSREQKCIDCKNSNFAQREEIKSRPSNRQLKSHAKEKVTVWFKEYKDERGVVHGAHENHIFLETKAKK